MIVRLATVLMTVVMCAMFPFHAHASHVCPSETSHPREIEPVQFSYDTLANYTIYFRHDKSVIDTNYLDNRRSLSAINSVLSELAAKCPESIATIFIEGHASPVGNIPYNERLSLKRAQETEAYLRSIPGIENVDMKVTGKGEDWETFIKEVKEGYKRKNRKTVFSILDSKMSIYKKERRLKALEKDQTTWRYLARHYMAGSRHAVTIVIVKKSRMLDILPRLDVPSAELEPLNQSSLSRPEDSNLIQPRIPVASIRTNLLVPGLNAGFELPLGNNWSVAADYYFPWFWPNQKNKNCFELLGWSVEGRYWFGRDRKPQDRLKGHSVGLYVAGGYYDFERNYRGMQGEFVSPGLDYTYSMAIGRKKNTHLQFTLAVGCIRSWGRAYNVYGDYGELYPDEGTIIWDYVGPTKAAVTLVVPFYKKEGSR